LAWRPRDIVLGQDVRQRRPVLVAELGGRRHPGGGRKRGAGSRPRRAISERTGDGPGWRRRWSRRSGCPTRRSVGKSARLIAEKVGHHPCPEGTRALDRAARRGAGRDYPLSIEKLCPVLSWYEVQEWREGCERCIQILRYGGMGHTMSIHSQNDDVILQFG
jgi:hypothetical protein